jgi:hypothetical protein
VIADAVLHLLNEQPLLVDLLQRPSPGDAVLVCTNLRSLSGKKPVWADEAESTFYFPYAVIRFLEIHPGAEETLELGPGEASSEVRPAPGRRARPAQAGAPRRGAAAGRPQPEPDVELEIDEDLLRRVRDV